jgi:hypothetical protein
MVGPRADTVLPGLQDVVTTGRRVPDARVAVHGAANRDELRGPVRSSLGPAVLWRNAIWRSGARQDRD